jgi:hypothetical protein
MAAIGAVIPAIVLGWLIVHLLSPNRKRAWLDGVFEVSLGAGVGLGLTSCIYFAMVLAGIASRAALFAVELVVIAAVVLLLRRNRTAATEGRVTPIIPAAIAMDLDPANRGGYRLRLHLPQLLGNDSD